MPAIPCGEKPAIDRRTTIGARRTASLTLRAPLLLSSRAISLPELPTPATKTSSPLKACGLRYAEACSRGARKDSRPVQGGRYGCLAAPVATTTTGLPWIVPDEVSTRHESQDRPMT